jgi:hypothetical protein
VRIINTKLTPSVNHSHVKEQYTQVEDFVEGYDKPVYCITVPEHILYVRRNGKPVWCGNSNRYGNKSVVTLLPDDEMPHLEDGTIAEVVMSPAATISRGNPGQLAELALGKITAMTGKTYDLKDFDDIDDWPAFVRGELEKHGIKPDAAVIDPKTGKRIINRDGSGMADGYMWMMKLHHTAEAKGSSRALGAYTANETPAKGGSEGAKRMSVSNLNALVSHGAYNVFQDAKYNRGQSNDEFWLSFMSGFDPPNKKTPFVYEKFVNSLKAAGINVKPSNNRLNLLALTDKDINYLAENREVSSGETIRWEKDGKPISGGLFDPSIFGLNQDRWGKVKLASPILNPVMEDPTRILLNLKKQELEDVMTGKREYGEFGTGMKAIYKALDSIDIPSAIIRNREIMTNGKKSDKDTAVRSLAYLKSAKSAGVHPRQWMLTQMPIMPPKYRPVSTMKDSDIPLIEGVNYLYKISIDTNNALKELKEITQNTQQEEAALYRSYKEVTGLADPTHPKLVQKNVRGLLKEIFGVGSSKFSTFQRNLVGTTTDAVGRGVVVSSPQLDMDEVGLPEESAWEVFRPYVMHNLAKRGFSPKLAAEAIENQNAAAKQALLQELEKRPVIMDRAPVLHKGSMWAFRPRLVKGSAVKINQFVQKGLNLDQDGDTMNFHVPFSKEAIEEAYKFMLPSKNPIAPADMKSPLNKIISENAGGLYLASSSVDKNKKTRTFLTWEDAERAFRRGELAIDDPVSVLKK